MTFRILISFIFLFEINKVNSFSALAALIPFIFLSSLTIADEPALVANLHKTSSAKETAKFNSAF